MPFLSKSANASCASAAERPCQPLCIRRVAHASSRARRELTGACTWLRGPEDILLASIELLKVVGASHHCRSRWVLLDRRPSSNLALSTLSGQFHGANSSPYATEAAVFLIHMFSCSAARCARSDLLTTPLHWHSHTSAARTDRDSVRQCLRAAEPVGCVYP